MIALSDQLHLEVDLAIKRLHQTRRATRVISGNANAGQLAQYYVNAHATVQHATTFLHTSRDTLRSQQGGSKLIELYDVKGQEESGHDTWLANDLAAIGFPLGAASTPTATAQAVFYNDFHHNLTRFCGEAFIGTAWVLEFLATRVAGPCADRLISNGNISGLRKGSAAGLTFLRSHSDADIEHTQELQSVVDNLIQSDAARSYVLMSARFTATLYADLF